MNTSTHQFDPVWHSKLIARVTATLAVTCILGLTASTANAARAKPSPTPVPATFVPAPEHIQTVSAENIRAVLSVDPGSDYIAEGEYVSGPTQPGGSAVKVSMVDGGNFWVTNLVADSDYVVRFKRSYFFNRTSNTLSPVTSNYTSFSFHTPSVEQSRPSAPAISFGQVTASDITVLWNPSTDNASSQQQISYFYNASNSVMNDPLLPTCQLYCFGTTGMTIKRPPSGTTLTVFAYDTAGNRSLPSNVLIVP